MTSPNRIRGYDTKPFTRYIKLYYRISQSPTNSGNNASETVFVTDPSAPGIYRGVSNTYMTDSNYVNYNTNIISFVGSRTPKNPALANTPMQVPDMYNEFININVAPYDSNYIQACANYVDEGSGFETTVPFVNYKVTAASGIFEGCTNLKIEFFNDANPPPPKYVPLGPVRNVIIT